MRKELREQFKEEFVKYMPETLFPHIDNWIDKHFVERGEEDRKKCACDEEGLCKYHAELDHPQDKQEECDCGFIRSCYKCNPSVKSPQELNEVVKESMQHIGK